MRGEIRAEEGGRTVEAPIKCLAEPATLSARRATVVDSMRFRQGSPGKAVALQHYSGTYP